MSEYVPSFPFYDAEPYWYKNRQGSDGDSGGSVLPSFGSLSKICSIRSNTMPGIVNEPPMSIEASIVIDDDVVITGYKYQIASGLHVIVGSDLLLGIAIATLTQDANDADVISSYTEIDHSTIGFNEGHFTMPALPDDQVLVFVYKRDEDIQ